jgi:hypothetical protein
LLTGSYLPADDLPDLSTERPGFSIPSAPVGLGVLQLEQGYTYEWARISGTSFKTFAAPQAMVRFGITKAFELRFSTVGYEWQQSLRFDGQRKKFTGGNDYVLGAKLRMVRQSEHGPVPEVSLIGGLSLPSRNSPFTSGGYDPYFTVAADKDLPRKFSLVANFNYASVTDAQGRLFSSGEGLWLTRSFKPVGVFAETFRTTIARGLGSEVVADMGCYKSLGKHVQIDAEAGHTIAGLRPSVYASVGLVIRGPRALIGPDRIRFHQSAN